MCLVFVSFSRSHSEAVIVSAVSRCSSDLWKLNGAPLSDQLLLTTGGAGELDAGRIRGHWGDSDHCREREGRTIQPQKCPDPRQSAVGRGGGVRLQSDTRWRASPGRCSQESLLKPLSPDVCPVRAEDQTWCSVSDSCRFTAVRLIIYCSRFLVFAVTFNKAFEHVTLVLKWFICHRKPFDEVLHDKISLRKGAFIGEALVV